MSFPLRDTLRLMPIIFFSMTLAGRTQPPPPGNGGSTCEGMNLRTFASFQNCFTGSNPQPDAELQCFLSFDVNGDEAVDLNDFALFPCDPDTCRECVGGTCQNRSCVATIDDVAVAPGGTAQLLATVANTSSSVTCTFDWIIGQTDGSTTVQMFPDSGSISLQPGEVLGLPILIVVPVGASDDSVSAEFLVIGGSGCFDTTTICIIPSNEMTTSNGWSFFPTVHLWQQTLLPTSTSFQGRTVTEVDPGGGVDTCWFVGSAFTPATAITGGTWEVNAGNVWGDDFVGWTGGAVLYYREQGRAPCSAVLPQDMVIDCPGSARRYFSNTLVVEIGETTVSSARNGQLATKIWP